MSLDRQTEKLGAREALDGKHSCLFTVTAEKYKYNICVRVSILKIVV